jgi:cysteine desulfurase/selenocysteine lyase
MRPWQGGGDMIERVSFAGTTYNEVPFRFEAGTPDIAGIVALGAAVDWLEELGLAAVAAHEHALMAHAERALNQIDRVRLVGSPAHRASIATFAVDGVHPQDIGTMLDLDGIAIRTGHHCAMPLHDRLGLAASARASFAVYNTEADIDALAHSLRRIVRTFS